MASLFKALRNIHLGLNRPHLYSIPRCLSTKSEVAKEEVKIEEPTIDNIMKGPVVYPTNFDKRVLVFAGRFKKVEDVPKYITGAMFDKARNKARIKLSNYMMLATALACIGVAISGRRAAERGESVHQMNLDWHKEQQSKK